MSGLLVVTGSRDASKQESSLLISSTVSKYNIDEIWHGGARGADSHAQDVADLLSLKSRVFEAEWNTLGKSAGVLRNRVMIRVAHAQSTNRLVMVLALFALSAKNIGTTDCVEQVMQCRLPLNIRWVPKEG